jgi:hypothetical protein
MFALDSNPKLAVEAVAQPLITPQVHTKELTSGDTAHNPFMPNDMFPLFFESGQL